MKALRVVGHSFRMMARYKLRTCFMMLGSLIGIAALTFVISAGQLVERKILQEVSREFGDSSIIVHDGGGEMMHGPRGPGIRLKTDDIEAIAKEVPGVMAWDPMQSLTTNVRHGEATDSVGVNGVSERYPQVWNRMASEGEFFDQPAVASSARVAVIGHTVAQKLFGNDDPVGADIQIGSVPFKVIGILERWGTNPHGGDMDNEVIVPILTLMHRLTNVDTISAARLLISDAAQDEQIKAQIQKELRDRHALGPGQPDDFAILTATQVHRLVEQIQRVLFVYLPLAAAVSLAIGGLVSASLMLSSINERVGEIGLRRAVGARPGDIRLQFLLETTTTILVGGIGGIAFGDIATEISATQMHLGNPNPWTAAALGILASCLVGLLAGVLPALRAARLQPAEALR